MKKSKHRHRVLKAKKKPARIKIFRKFSLSRIQLAVLALAVASLGIYFVFFASAAGPPLDKFPLATNKYDLEYHWPDSELRSYLSNGNAHCSSARCYEASDIFAPPGTKIVAAKAGTVTTSKDGNCSGGSGASVYVKDSSGYLHMYLHMQNGKRTVSTGKKVSAGTTLGVVGASGCAKNTSPHLHYEVRLNNVRQHVQTSVTKAFFDKLPSWKRLPSLPSKLRAIDIGRGSDGIFVAASDGRVYQYTGGKWKQYAGTYSTQVDAGKEVWRVGYLGRLYRSESWQYSGFEANDVGVNEDERVVAITKNNGYQRRPAGCVFQWVGNINITSTLGWQPLSGFRDGSSVGCGAVKLDISGSGTPWKVVSSGNIYRFNRTEFEKDNPDPWSKVNVSGKCCEAKDIGIGDNNGVWIITEETAGGGYRIAKWNAKTGSDSLFVKTSQGGGTRITVSPAGIPYIVNSGGAVYHYWKTSP